MGVASHHCSALLVVATVFTAFLVTPVTATVNIDSVVIGDVGNAADPATGSVYGAVAYEYRIARNETTISQYTEFLNAVAKTDPYGLYSTNMTDPLINGIDRSGSSGAYSYAVKGGSGDKPVTFVSWFDAARFCNWVHNGQKTGAAAAVSAEGGAYDLNGHTSGSFNKTVGATIWIPSEDEWYKAAYYDSNKSGAGIGGYWLQATKSDALAGNTIGVANSANYYDGDYVGSGNGLVPVANALTTVGAYGVNSESAYGTNDQSGNVWEWNDGYGSGSARGQRGGAWYGGLYAFTQPSAEYALFANPASENSVVGFRVAFASVPEPSTYLLTMITVGLAFVRRRR